MRREGKGEREGEKRGKGGWVELGGKGSGVRVVVGWMRRPVRKMGADVERKRAEEEEDENEEEVKVLVDGDGEKDQGILSPP